MTSPGPSAPTTHYVYVVVDVADSAGGPLHIAASRRAAREWMQWQPESDSMRVRRARLMIYAS